MSKKKISKATKKEQYAYYKVWYKEKMKDKKWRKNRAKKSLVSYYKNKPSDK